MFRIGGILPPNAGDIAVDDAVFRLSISGSAIEVYRAILLTSFAHLNFRGAPPSPQVVPKFKDQAYRTERQKPPKMRLRVYIV